MSTNRRKSCALTPQNAHNGALGVRVGALTNKAAHYRFDLVRTALCASSTYVDSQRDGRRYLPQTVRCRRAFA